LNLWNPDGFTTIVAPDTTPPTASITSPSDGSEVSGTIEITADASDSQSGVQKVEFWHATVGTQIGTDTESPYSINWDTTSVINGLHNLWVVAYDNATNWINSEEVSVTVNNVTEIYGCTDPTAFNYNPAANTDDGSCVPVILGCTDPTAFNYNQTANTDDGSCVPVIMGCTDSTALNYNSQANTDDGSCIAPILGCTNSEALNYNPEANTDDGSCIYPVSGCTDLGAINYNPEATEDDGTCIYPVLGCTDTETINYNPEATQNDGSCIYPIYGCTDETALNYNSEANTDDDSCTYEEEPTDVCPNLDDPQAEVPDGYELVNGECVLIEGEAICGDSLVNDLSEECDDGNMINGDGCSANCKIETIYNILGGQFAISSGSGDSTPSVITIGDTTINVDANGGTSTISIPDGTIISRTDGENMSVGDLSAGDVSTETLSGLGESVVVDGALQWGIENLGLQFSTPITISIFVGESFNGQTLDIVRSTSGSDGWTNDGISPTTCVVSSGLCTFQATKASYYAATHSGSSGGDDSDEGGETGGGGGGGGGGNPGSVELKISNEANTNITEAGVTITWTTNYAATSQIIYAAEGENHALNLNDFHGNPPKYGYARTTAEYDEVPKVINHSITITDLTPGTTYYYRTVSHGSLAVGEERTFTTLGEQQIIPLTETGNIGMGETAETATKEITGESFTNKTTPEIVLRANEEVETVAQQEESVILPLSTDQEKLLSKNLNLFSALAIASKEIFKSGLHGTLVIILVIVLILVLTGTASQWHGRIRRRGRKNKLEVKIK
jgi:cysteine-rich repeat protein